MDFALFVLLNAVLLIRPAEIVTELDRLPIYNILMLANLAVSGVKILHLLNPNYLRRDPISCAVLGLLAAVVLSHVSHLIFDQARWALLDFGKVVIYYFLLVATIDSPRRLRNFLGCLVFFIIVLSSVALLQYHGFVDIPALRPVADGEVDESTGELYALMRLCSTGIYNDPNDLCLILLIGMGCCLYAASDRSRGPFRLAWLAPVALFGYALMLTHSRGGFLAMVGAVAVLARAKFGLKKALPLLAVVFPVIIIFFAGRQTNISTSEDTGQDRIQLWAEGLTMLRGSPLFGVGWNTYQEHAGLVAHNSFVHGFAELGLFGGILYLGMFGYCIGTLERLKSCDLMARDATLANLRPFLQTMIAAYFFGTMTISRNYVVPTYMIVGVVASYFRITLQNSPDLMPDPIQPVGGTLAARWIGAGVGFIICAHLFIRLFARWS